MPHKSSGQCNRQRQETDPEKCTCLTWKQAPSKSRVSEEQGEGHNTVTHTCDPAVGRLWQADCRLHPTLAKQRLSQRANQFIPLLVPLCGRTGLKKTSVNCHEAWMLGLGSSDPCTSLVWPYMLLSAWCRRGQQAHKHVRLLGYTNLGWSPHAHVCAHTHTPLHTTLLPETNLTENIPYLSLCKR